MDDAALAGTWRAATTELLTRTRFTLPGRLPGAVADAAATTGSDPYLYLSDHEQSGLHPFPPGGEAFDVDASPAGEAFRTTSPVPDGGRLWYPLLDGSERLGVIRLDRAAVDVPDRDVRAEVDRFVALVGHLLSVMSAYGDAFELVRRTGRMSPAAELVRQLLPPLTYGADRFVVSAILQPVYTVGGDAFDYAVTGSRLHLAVLDSTGHHLRAGLTSAVALSAYRAARRAGDGLIGQARAVDDAVTAEFGDSRFSTAVLAALDLDTGELSYLNAGHPPPLVLRGDRVVGRLDGGRRTPLGIPPRGAGPEPGRFRLESGDRLLAYTDGVTEAVCEDGTELGVDRLTALAVRHAGAGLPPPETLRQMSRELRRHGPAADDATLLFVEWAGEAVRRLAP